MAAFEKNPRRSKEVAINNIKLFYGEVSETDDIKKVFF